MVSSWRDIPGWLVGMGSDVCGMGVGEVREVGGV
jgi:hypothetical protein